MWHLLLGNAELSKEQGAARGDVGSLLDPPAMTATAEHANVLCLYSLHSPRTPTPSTEASKRGRVFSFKGLLFIKEWLFPLHSKRVLKISTSVAFRVFCSKSWVFPKEVA